MVVAGCEGSEFLMRQLVGRHLQCHKVEPSCRGVSDPGPVGRGGEVERVAKDRKGSRAQGYRTFLVLVVAEVVAVIHLLRIGDTRYGAADVERERTRVSDLQYQGRGGLYPEQGQACLE